MPIATSRLVTVALAAYVVACSGTVPVTRTITQTIAVPAYFDPSGSGATAWNQISTAASISGSVVIANVDSGPGTAVDSNWQSVIQAAHNAGVKVLGYVDTGYLGSTGRTTRSGSTTQADWITQAEADVTSWYSFYGTNIVGIFYDDATNDCTYATTYTQLTQYVKTSHSSALVIINPGADVPQCYQNSADIILTFEGSFTDYVSFTPASWEGSVADTKFYHIIYSTPAANLQYAVNLTKNNNAGYVYITDANLPNPYNALPSFWSAELTEVHVSGANPPPPPHPVAPSTTATAQNQSPQSVYLQDSAASQLPTVAVVLMLAVAFAHLLL